MQYLQYWALSFIPMVTLAQNQQTIPYAHSPNGEMVYDTYDTFLNDEYGGLNFFFESETSLYEKGTYYIKGNDIGTTALIKLHNENKIRVKNQLFSESVKIDANKLDYYTTKVDSFFVADRIKLKDKSINEPTILQYLGDSEKADYAMYYKLNNGTVSKKKILHLKKEEGALWVELDLNAKDPKKILALFGFHKALNNYYDEQELTINDFLNSLKVEEYYDHHVNSTNILYDKLWREVKKSELASYYGKVTKVVDSIFTVEISDDKGQKLYNLNYSSLHPLKRHGKLIGYDGGTIKTERIYDYGDLISSKRYKNGKTILEFDYFKFERGDDKPDVMRRRAVLIDAHPIKTYGNSSATMEQFGQQTYYELDKKNIISAYETKADDKMHFYSNYTEPLDFQHLTYSLRTFFEGNAGYINSMTSKDFEGSMMLQIATDFKGRVISYEILNSNNDALYKLVEPFCESFLKSDGRNTIRFKQIKLEGKQDRCTFVLPINFEHRQFYKTFSRPNYNNWNWHWHWQQQMMWHQQQVQQNMLRSLPKF